MPGNKMDANYSPITKYAVITDQLTSAKLI